MKTSVIIPSRLGVNPHDAAGALWLERALQSVRDQTLWGRVDLEVVVGSDPGAAIPERLKAIRGITLRVVQPVSSGGSGQAAAVNAAVRAAQGDVIALLEDDDQWAPTRLEHTLAALEGFDFVSSNQLEVDPEGHPQALFDFPTPSGWLMHRELWEQTGGMDEALRWHVDTEWLGRLNRTGRKRCHLVEAGCPRDAKTLQRKRPDLGTLLRCAPPGSVVRHHPETLPLVLRTVGAHSGMARVREDAEAGRRSEEEMRIIRERFGGFPH